MNGRIVKVANRNMAKSNLSVGDKYEGKFYDKPIVGRPFKIGAYETSNVQALLPDNAFRTLNSDYKLQLWW
jgi:hypothetical protein